MSDRGGCILVHRLFCNADNKAGVLFYPLGNNFSLGPTNVFNSLSFLEFNFESSIHDSAGE